MKVLKQQAVTSSRYLNHYNRLSDSYQENLLKLGFVQTDYSIYVALSSNGDDVIVYDVDAGTFTKFTNAALDDYGQSFIEASRDYDEYRAFIDEHGCDEIPTTLEELLSL